MPTRDGYPEGVPAWVDLGTPNLDGAKTFYRAMFGWEFEEEGDESNPYAVALRRGLPAAGIGSLPRESSLSSWSTYFAVDDTDSTVLRIRRAGGSILAEPGNVGTAGRVAFATDPTGATFGVWQAGDRFGAAVVNEHGSLNWNELLTDDVTAALSFYGAVFGHEVETSELGGGVRYSTLGVGGRPLAGVMARRRPEIPTGWGVYFAVESAQDAVATAQTNGGEVITEPRHVEGAGIITRLVDPYGAGFATIELDIEID